MRSKSVVLGSQEREHGQGLWSLSKVMITVQEKLGGGEVKGNEGSE